MTNHRPRWDDEFDTHQSIQFEPANDWAEDFNIYAYLPMIGEDTTWVNVEFGLSSNIIDAYFYPEDLERLGIMFQYLGKTAREARDGDS